MKPIGVPKIRNIPFQSTARMGRKPAFNYDLLQIVKIERNALGYVQEEQVNQNDKTSAFCLLKTALISGKNGKKKTSWLEGKRAPADRHQKMHH